MATSASVRVIPLGGAGEIGKNMYVVEHGDRMVLIDCGITFPKNDQMGVDIVLPDFSYVVERRDNLEALILTHGHEDHIGAVPFLHPRRRPDADLRRGASRSALLRAKLEEHRLLDKAELIEVPYGDPGPDRALLDRVRPAHPLHARLRRRRARDPRRHDRPHRRLRHRVRARSAAAAATSPPSRGSASGASSCCWPTRPTPRRARMSSPLPTRDVQNELARIFAIARGRVLVTTFSSHIHRVQQVLDAAYADGRVVALVGRSLTRNVDDGEQPDRPGHRARPTSRRPPGTLVRLRELESRPRDEQVLICTGSQGEPMAALSRIARGEHNQVQIAPGDTVLYSSSTVPGNELAVNEIVNRLVRADAELHHRAPRTRKVHVSGHGSASDLLLMLELIRPRVLRPDPRRGAPPARARRAGRAPSASASDRITILDNGDVLEVTRRLGDRSVDRVHAGLSYVDQAGGGDITESVLRDRRHLADDGLILVVARVDASDGAAVRRDRDRDPRLRLRPGRGAHRGDPRGGGAQPRPPRPGSASSRSGVLQHQLHDTSPG